MKPSGKDYKAIAKSSLIGGVGFLVALLQPTLTHAQTPEALLDNVRVAWTERQESVKAVRVSWTQNNTMPKGTMTLIGAEDGKSGRSLPPTDTAQAAKGTLLLDGNKSRITIKTRIWDLPTNAFQTWVVDSVVQDGKYTCLNRFENQPYPTGSIQNADANPLRGVSLWPIVAAFRGTDVTTTGQNAISSFTNARKSSLGGISFVEVARERQELRGEARLWVDPAQAYIPRRLDQYARDGSLQYSITINSRKDASGIWTPASWKTVKYRGSKLIGVVETSVTDLAINPALGADAFSLEFPNGTKVSDSTGSETRDYIVRESGKVREIPRQELGQKYDDLLRTEPGELVPRSTPAFPLSQWNIWLGVCSVGFGVGLLVWRRYRTRT